MAQILYIGILMFNYGLIGKKLSHSYSKDIHNKLFNNEYDLKELNEEEFSFFMQEKSFKGINITIPYKQDVMKYLDYIDDDAKEIGAVNTVVNNNGMLKGYNTDIFGLEYLVKKANIELGNKNILILGTGGTSKTIYQLLKKHNAKVIYKVSRSSKSDIDSITYDELNNKYNDFDVIINSTPCGMYPNLYDKPIDLSVMTNLEAVVDVIYNPLRTLLRLEADKRKLKAVNGLYMLVAQAVFADSIFFNKKVDETSIENIYYDLLNQKLNISLIGMPFSGKSTVGKQLAKKLNKGFLDVDQYITTKYNRTPAEIINNDGEQKFRDIETEVIKEIATLSNYVFASGGGSVLREENVDRLRMTSLMVYIKRDNPIITSDRPLSSNKQMFDELFAKRKLIYEKSADIEVYNNDNVDICINEIITYINNKKLVF